MAVSGRILESVQNVKAAERRVQELDLRAVNTGMVNEKQWERAKRDLAISVIRLERAVAG